MHGCVMASRTSPSSSYTSVPAPQYPSISCSYRASFSVPSRPLRSPSTAPSAELCFGLCGALLGVFLKVNDARRLRVALRSFLCLLLLPLSAECLKTFPSSASLLPSHYRLWMEAEPSASAWPLESGLRSLILLSPVPPSLSAPSPDSPESPPFPSLPHPASRAQSSRHLTVALFASPLSASFLRDRMRVAGGSCGLMNARREGEEPCFLIPFSSLSSPASASRHAAASCIRGSSLSLFSRCAPRSPFEGPFSALASSMRRLLVAAPSLDAASFSPAPSSPSRPSTLCTSPIFTSPLFASSLSASSLFAVSRSASSPPPFGDAWALLGRREVPRGGAQTATRRGADAKASGSEKDEGDSCGTWFASLRGAPRTPFVGSARLGHTGALTFTSSCEVAVVSPLHALEGEEGAFVAEKHKRCPRAMSSSANLARAQTPCGLGSLEMKVKVPTPALKPRTRKSIAKRFKITATGKLLYRHSGRQHKMKCKSGRRKRRLRKVGVLSGRMAVKYLACIHTARARIKRRKTVPQPVFKIRTPRKRRS